MKSTTNNHQNVIESLYHIKEILLWADHNFKEPLGIMNMDSKNPFMGKQIHEVVTIRGEKYSIRRIIKST